MLPLNVVPALFPVDDRATMTNLSTIEEANAELTLRLRQQELAAAFANFGLGTDDLQSVLDEACIVAAKGMECSLAKVLEYLPDDNCFIMRAGVGWGPGVVGHARLGSDLESAAGFAFRTSQPVISNHLTEEKRFRTPQLLLEHGVHRAFNVLVATSEWRYGVLEVDSPDRRDFSVLDTSFLETLAATLAQAIGKQRRIGELRESRAFARAVLGATPDRVEVLSVDGEVRFANHAGESEERPSASHDMAGGQFISRWHAEASDDILRSIRRATTGQIVKLEVQAAGECSGQQWCELNFGPFLTDRSVTTQVICVTHDISERKRAEEALRASEARLRVLNARLEGHVRDRTRDFDQLWELSEDLLVVADYDARVLKANSYWTRLLGWSEEQILESGFAALIHPDEVEAVMGALINMRESRLPISFEHRVKAHDGTWRHVAWRLSPEPGGRCLTGVGRDVTVAKEQQRQLAITQESLRQSQKMEAVGQLTGGLAHDFNNLLTGISGSLELLQSRMRHGRLEDMGRYINAAQEASRRAAALTHRLLAFSRRQTLDSKPTDVERLISGMLDMIQRTVGPEIEVDVISSPDAWAAVVDPHQLENALLNLCINARDAMPDGGRLTIETANRWIDERVAKEHDFEPGPYLSLSVSDTGTGMTPEVVARAFDPFFTTKPIGMGTGLGLSMIYGFAKQSGGQVRIHSQPGEGTSVSLFLPRREGAEVTDDARLDEATALPRAARGETVLVVDDEPTIRMLIGEILADLDYMAIEAAEGVAGLNILKSDIRVDLLITDVGLPGGMNGRQLADAARVLRPSLKVLFITGYAEKAAVSGGHLEAGMQVMTKPFAMDELATRISQMIGDR